MDFRKLLLISLALLFALQAAAITIEELQDLYYQTEDAAEFSRAAGAFIEASDALGELDHAFGLWQGFAPDSCQTWLETKAEDAAAAPKYKYLLLNLAEDVQTRLDGARGLITAHPDFAGGYRALLLTLVQDLAADELADPESPFHSQLQSNLPLLAQFGANFPGDEYTRMALVYQLLQSGDAEAAKVTFREALEAEEAWIDDIGLGQMFTPDKYHPLLAYQIELMRPNDADAYTKYRIAELAGDLVDYHFDQAKDYDAVIAYFGAEPWYWENQYVLYALTQSYLAKDQPDRAVTLLNGNGDLPAALQFQDSWLAFDPDQAASAYARVLEPVATDPAHAYLLARSLADNDEKLARARALVASHPKVEHGYSLATEIYLDYFTNYSPDDPQLARMNSSLQNDAQILRNYYFRFPANNLATVGYFLVNVLEKDVDKALRSFQELQEAGLGEMVGNSFARFTLDHGGSDLLLRIKEYEVRQNEANDELSEAEIAAQAGKAFCITLSENELYEELSASVAQHPQWMDDPEIQYMLVNAFYLRDDIPNTISTLRLMVEKGTLGTTMLNGLDDPDLTGHPDWQALLDYASTLPDPDAGADAEVPKE
ncbi:MAG TPA: hypothetical protein PLQ80_09380 [Candidatus Syntrophosphaera sp.]|nr:hypothetical protein [Candidatus Syntrophosphaera sp.]HPH60188.1 hypothetical protein [Candidatus Syntrophosphaera sp.]